MKMHAHIQRCLTMLLLCSCAAGHVLTPENFNSIAEGASIAQIEKMYGSPYDVKKLADDAEEYRYLQRVYVNNTIADQIEYVFIVSEGRVIGKQRRDIGSAANIQVLQ